MFMPSGNAEASSQYQCLSYCISIQNSHPWYISSSAKGQREEQGGWSFKQSSENSVARNKMEPLLGLRQAHHWATIQMYNATTRHTTRPTLDQQKALEVSTWTSSRPQLVTRITTASLIYRALGAKTISFLLLRHEVARLQNNTNTREATKSDR